MSFETVWSFNGYYINFMNANAANFFSFSFQLAWFDR